MVWLVWPGDNRGCNLLAGQKALPNRALVPAALS